MKQFNYGVTGSTLMGMRSGNPFVQAAAEDNAFGHQKQHEQDMFERGMMQQEQGRRNQETAMQGQAMQQKYKILGGLINRG
jgi:hypothetical protein